jgi:hypothetical protein
MSRSRIVVDLHDFREGMSGFSIKSFQVGTDVATPAE